ncbi:hypothetical protein SADUNF_Sadunf09G0081000 [Salix dunnii]|uniref:Uncharacterized protein n=1 Tax=Salix dunnii TaxID=1413687 RepID=A0A835JUW5_9ROSI|nr:hypothetical protein SADUNF_Sadunf09G0081000 [Salix dunnii]
MHINKKWVRASMVTLFAPGSGSQVVSGFTRVQPPVGSKESGFTRVQSPVGEYEMAGVGCWIGIRGLILICTTSGMTSGCATPLEETVTTLQLFPSETITIFIEDYVTSPRGLTKVDAAGLMNYWFPVSRMPKNDGKWPTVDDMVQKNQRLVVFC